MFRMFWNTKIHKNRPLHPVGEDGSVISRADVRRTIESFEQYEIVPSSERAFRLRNEFGRPLPLHAPMNLFIGPTARSLLGSENTETNSARTVLQTDRFKFWEHLENTETSKLPQNSIPSVFRPSMSSVSRETHVNGTRADMSNRRACLNQLVIFSHFTLYDENKIPVLVGDVQHRNGEKLHCPLCYCGATHPEDSYVVIDSGTPDGDPCAVVWCPPTATCFGIYAFCCSRFCLVCPILDYKGFIQGAEELDNDGDKYINASKILKIVTEVVFQSKNDEIDHFRRRTSLHVCTVVRNNSIPIFATNAPMGSGKTEVLCRMVKARLFKKVLLITNRRS